MKLREISDKIYANVEDRERMEKMNEIYYDMAEYIQNINPSLYRDYCDEAEGILYGITDEESEMIVRNMRPYGEHWNREVVDNYIMSRGETPSKEYYLVMNMAFNDYRNTAQMMGMDTDDFYYSLAHDFIHDPDGPKHKVEKYFKDDKK